MRLLSRSLTFLAFFAAVCAVLTPAWAINPPEPESGGRYFYSKGTKSSSDYRYESRTRSRSYDNYEYGNGLRWKNLRVKPNVAYQGDWDSNIFLQDDDPQSDYINRLLWGVDADAPFEDGKYFLTGGVQSSTEWFADHSDQNHTDWDYRLGGEANFNEFSVSVHENLRDTQERTDTELTQRIERYENYLSGLVNVPFGRFFSETEVDDYILNFKDTGFFDSLDRHEFSVYPRLGVDIGTRTQALVEYGFTDINYQHNADRDGFVHQGRLGVRGFMGKSDLISYQLWGGWQFRNYNGDLDDFNNFVGLGEIVYKPTEIQEFLLRINRKPVESTEVGQTFFVNNEMLLRYRRQIAENVYANAHGSVGFNHYDNDRLDFIWEPGGGLEYVLPKKILSLFADYTYSGRSSDADGRDYNRHLVNFGIKAEV